MIRSLEMDRDFDVDLENGALVCEEDSRKSPNSGVKKQAKSLLDKVYDRLIDVPSRDDEEKIGSCYTSPNSKNGVSLDFANPLLSSNNNKLECERSPDNEKRKKSLSNKKASKPPRPPRGPSLDAADQKLIREITELAILKRARIERMRALKKLRTAKASSSNGNLFAMVFTVLFCLVILFQGMSPRAASGIVQGSPVSNRRTQGDLISVQYIGNPSATEPNGAYSLPPNFGEPVMGFDNKEKLRRVSG